MRIELAAPTAEDTRAIGGALASLLRAGDVVALTGELGAGKTTLVQGVANALDYSGAVASPTFTLVREYRTPSLRIVHADVYRLDRVQEVLDLGLPELVEGDGVLLVEWGDAVAEVLPGEPLVVELVVPGDGAGNGEERAISIRGGGGSWASRWERLEQVLDRWSVGA
ncbi:MAG: tRNA (adenosine(37)-N6)-threonylcarbamoyltransferase complex ATPase subunit type 1 TsaE [Actinomycetota bacterium]